MAHELRSVQKIGLNNTQTAAPAAPAAAGGVTANAAPAAPAVIGTLELRVTKTGGPVATFVEVASSGTDDQVFDDHDLTPGPAQMPLLQGNFYTVVWRGAFVAQGAATLHVLARLTDGTVIVQKDVPVEHPPINSPFTIVVL
jgi:hypothetical protein